MLEGRRRKCKCCRKLFRPDPRKSASSALLLAASVQDGEESRMPGPLARSAGEPRLLPRPRAPRPQPSLASASSRLLAQVPAPPQCA